MEWSGSSFAILANAVTFCPAFLQNIDKCELKFRFLSIVTPNNFSSEHSHINSSTTLCSFMLPDIDLVS